MELYLRTGFFSMEGTAVPSLLFSSRKSEKRGKKEENCAFLSTAFADSISSTQLCPKFHPTPHALIPT